MSGIRIVDMPDLGVITDDSSVVGEHAGSGRFSMLAMRSYMGRGIVNVLDHGAFGDGSHDDTDAIQRALDTFAGAAIVFVPDTGKPFMVGGLTLASGTDLLLHGTLKSIPNTPTHLINFALDQTAANITIRGHGTLDGNDVNQGARHVAGGINGTCNNLLVTGITIKNTSVWNLNITLSTHVRVDKVTLIGGWAANEFAVNCDDCWLTGCHIIGPTGSDEGFSFYGGVTNSGATGNTVEGAGATGFSVLNDSAQTAPCKNITISNNIIHGCQYGGIAVDQGAGGVAPHSAITIANNRVYNNNLVNGPQCAQIVINQAHSVTVTGNMVSDASAYGANDAVYACAYGIQTEPSASNVTITGNTIFDVGNGARAGFGVFIGGSDFVNAGGNTFQDSRTTPYMTGIAGTAGKLSNFTNNMFGNLVTQSSLAVQLDTLIANSIFGTLTIGGGAHGPINLTIAGTTGYGCSLEYLSGVTARWYVGTDGTAETGSNTGADFEISSVDDTGRTPTQLITIKRSTGIVTFRLPPSFATLPINAADDTAAAAAGVPFLGIYRNGSVLMFRAS